MNICVIGSGYVGLCQAAILAETGNKVTCIDIDTKKLESLSLGKIPFYEPGLSELVLNNQKAGRLEFTNTIPTLISYDMIFVCVGTPEKPDGRPNLTYLYNAYDSIVEYVKSQNSTKTFLVVNKSTVPVGTAKLANLYFEDKFKGSYFDVHVVSNPEFLKEGTAVSDCMKPDRIIVGYDYVNYDDGCVKSEWIEHKFKTLYAPFAYSKDKLLFMDSTSAEMTKYAANCMLMTRISLMNELANIAEKVGADINNVRKGIGSDARIGNQFLYPGPGTGGSCFIKDIDALIYTAEDLDYNPKILQEVSAFNFYRMNNYTYDMVHDFYKNYLGTDIKNKTFAVLGLAFKANTDDIRQSASIPLVEKLLEFGAYVKIYDPKATYDFNDDENVTICNSLEQALSDSNAAIIMTEWNEFRNSSLFTHKNLLDNIVFDARNLFNLETMVAQDVTYVSVGRPVVYGTNTVDNFEEN